MEYIKNFLDWINRKEKLHYSEHKPPLVKERDVWWSSLGENVGSEMNGKSSDFSRPVIIVKKFTHTFYLVIPTTTKMHEGSWYAPFDLAGVKMNACMHQARVIDYRRIHSKIGQIDSTEFNRIKNQFKNLI